MYISTKEMIWVLNKVWISILIQSKLLSKVQTLGIKIQNSVATWVFWSASSYSPWALICSSRGQFLTPLQFGWWNPFNAQPLARV